MALSVRVDSIAKDIDIIIRQELGPEARSKVIANFARQELRKGQDQNQRVLGRVPPHRTFVDGVQGASEDRVKPDGGLIAYEFELVTGGLAWIDQQLQLHAPDKTGRFKRGFVFFADGAQVDPDNPPPAKVYTFTNREPYTRKIEGVEGREPQSPQAPDGVFEAVAALGRHKYGRLMKVQFGFTTISSGERYQPAITVTVR